VVPVTLIKSTDQKILLKSFSDDKKWYQINITQKFCNCPAFKPSGWHAGCKHLSALGIYRLDQYNLTPYPTFSQALSGLVKSIRIRNISEAVYWLIYMHKGDKKNYFRVAKRLLIGTAEDGHNIEVMEKCASKMKVLCDPNVHIIHWIAEVVRICNYPNWWEEETGGHGYIYDWLVAWRKSMYLHKFGVEAGQPLIKQGIESGLPSQGLLGFYGISRELSSTEQAEYIRSLAEDILLNSEVREMVIRLCDIHLRCKSFLAGDSNFIGIALWLLCGGKFKTYPHSEGVEAWVAEQYLHDAQESWKTPHKIPEWCCDGLHCSGNDPRFAGMLPTMYSVCLAHHYYGQMNPELEWLPKFFPKDGLVWKEYH
jgi:hypothetical protein